MVRNNARMRNWTSVICHILVSRNSLLLQGPLDFWGGQHTKTQNWKLPEDSWGSCTESSPSSQNLTVLEGSHNKADEALRKCPSPEWKMSWLAMQGGHDFPHPHYTFQTWRVYCVLNFIVFRLLTFSIFFHCWQEGIPASLNGSVHKGQDNENKNIFLRNILRWDETSKPASNPDVLLLQKESRWCSTQGSRWVPPEQPRTKGSWSTSQKTTDAAFSGVCSGYVRDVLLP